MYAALFGSAARGDVRTDSDIDIVFVREGAATEGWHDQVDSLARDITAWTGNDTHPLEFTVDAIRDRARDEPVLREIIRDAHTVQGDLSALRRLVGEG